jgi:hypothetical protein
LQAFQDRIKSRKGGIMTTAPWNCENELDRIAASKPIFTIISDNLLTGTDQDILNYGISTSVFAEEGRGSARYNGVPLN